MNGGNVRTLLVSFLVLAVLQQGSASRAAFALRGRSLVGCEVIAISRATSSGEVDKAVGSALSEAYAQVHSCDDVYSTVQAKQQTIAQAVARALVDTSASVSTGCTGNSYASAKGSATGVAKAVAFAAAEAIAGASNYNAQVVSKARGEDYQVAIDKAVARSHSYVKGEGYAQNRVFAEAVATAVAEVTATAIASVYC